ncbi:MAG: TIGR01212 family radical SAM protein [Clostridia bacterium]|nr:TIGR01212 family radical SAM protein [Clostridia bacterium]
MKGEQVGRFPYSDTNKRYHTYDYYLRRRYGGKCVKISLDGGFTCPNRDGRCGYGGCIFCSLHGSGDFTYASHGIREQYEHQKELLSKKWRADFYIPYLQAHTNTYAPVEVLSRVYREAMALPGAVALHIATRADCLGDDVLALLRAVSEEIDLTVELGLQSAHDVTAERIHRGHTFLDFCRGYERLRRHVPKARAAVHLINGLPGEDHAMMLESTRAVANLRFDEVKLHLLHVLRGTAMADLYERGDYIPMTKEDYVATVADEIELLPPATVIARVTGDGDKRTLLAPLWSTDKRSVLNAIDAEMARRGSFQGEKWKNNV